MIEKTTVNGKITHKLADFASAYGMLLSLTLLFFVSFIYLYWFGNGIFFYQENRCLFIYSGEYFQKFMVKPGGLLSYAAIFLTQGFFSPLYGSLLISILIILICLTFKAIVKHLAVNRSFSLLIILLPSVLFLLLQVRYEYQLQLTSGFFLTFSSTIFAILFVCSREKPGAALIVIINSP